MCSAGRSHASLSPRWRGQHQNTPAQSHLRAQGSMPVVVLRLADGDEHLHLVVNEVGEVILDNGPAFVRPGLWPNQAGPGDARCVQQSILCSERTTRGSLRFSNFLLPRVAPSTLPDRITICCLFRCGGPSGKKKGKWPARAVRVCEKGREANDLAAVGTRHNSICQPFHLSSTPLCCQAVSP